MYNVSTVRFIITFFNVGSVLLCVIYQLNFTVCMYVTRISCYMTLCIAFGIIRGRSCNVLPMDTAVRLLFINTIFFLPVATSQ